MRAGFSVKSRVTTSIGLFLFDYISISSSSLEEKSLTISAFCFSWALNYFSSYSFEALRASDVWFTSYAWCFLIKRRRFLSPISKKRFSIRCHMGIEDIWLSAPELVELIIPLVAGDYYCALFLSSLGCHILCPINSSSFRTTAPDISMPF